MECILRDIPHVCVFLGHICIILTGVDDAEHNDDISEVLDILNKAGLRLNTGKCYFKKVSVNYLGLRIDAQGLHPFEGVGTSTPECDGT